MTLLLPGTVVDRYQIVRHIASGGMGAVYQATHVMLGRPLALKILHQSGSNGENADRLLCEARTAASIRHPGVVDVLDFGYFDERPYLVMELLPGKPLYELLEASMLPSRARLWAQQLATILAAVHDGGIIHGDVTSSNVHIDGDDVKLLDFGLAQPRRSLAPSRPSGTFTGTPAYVSPEQIRGENATEFSDQYSFGVVLHEMLTTRHPYEGTDVDELCHRHLEDPIPTIPPPHSVPLELEEVMQRCLAKKPGQRYASMHEIVLALGKIAQAEATLTLNKPPQAASS